MTDILQFSNTDPRYIPKGNYTLHEFWTACKNHDWYTDWSDDGRVYAEGVHRRRLLQAIAMQSSEHQAIYKGWHDSVYSGSSFGREELAPPEEPAISDEEE